MTIDVGRTCMLTRTILIFHATLMISQSNKRLRKEMNVKQKSHSRINCINDKIDGFQYESKHFFDMNVKLEHVRSKLEQETENSYPLIIGIIDDTNCDGNPSNSTKGVLFAIDCCVPIKYVHFVKTITFDQVM